MKKNLVFLFAIVFLVGCTSCVSDRISQNQLSVAPSSDVVSHMGEAGDTDITTESVGTQQVLETNSADTGDEKNDQSTSSDSRVDDIGTESTESSSVTDVPQFCAHNYGAWTVTKEASCKNAGERKCECTLCGEVKTESVARLAHTEVVDYGYSATCTKFGLTNGKHCGVCQAVLVEQISIDKTDHTEQTVAGIPATDTASGLSAGIKCSACNQVLVEQKVIEPYLISCKSEYAYKDLLNHSNGTACQSLYERIDEQAVLFHGNDYTAAMSEGYYLAFSINYSDLGLSTDDAVYVWNSYKSDHPLYYWMSNTLSYSAERINILTDAAYSTGNDRRSYNTMIYKKLTEWYSIAAGETSPYQIALAYHDAIIDEIDYAYESDGTTPEDAAWAHNILGVFEKKKGVCESYAKTFQLLLNMRGIDNLLVTGVAGTDKNSLEDHAWNLAKMDDGKWYWFDLTWDDVKWEHQTLKWGIRHNYFCVNDTQNVAWVDDINGNQPPSQSFMDQHEPGKTLNNSFEDKMNLPARSTSVFSVGNGILRSTFTVDRTKYSVAGYNAVQLLSTDKEGVVVIPEFIEKGGRKYTVISLGSADPTNGYYTTYGTTVVNNATKVVIPKTVKFIWDMALSGKIGEIEVASDSSYFASVDGVLFTKSLYTLIRYPVDAPYRDKYTIPEGTVDIATCAFLNLNNGIGELVFSSTLDGLGQANWGYGYHNKKPTGPFGGNYVGGEIASLLEQASWQSRTVKVTVPTSCSGFKIIDGVLYSVHEGKISVAIVGLDMVSQTIELAEGTQRIGERAFASSKSLKTLIIPESVDGIFGYIFGSNKDVSVIFNGTQSRWDQLVGSGSMWACTDPNAVIKVTCKK